MRRMTALVRRSLGALVAATATLSSAGCGDSPTEPTPIELTLACPAPLSVVATSAAGAMVTFGMPTHTGGLPPVAVSCSASSGGVFPVGRTAVTCTARDRANQLAACAFDVRVTDAPRLSLTRFMAFGDSITAGEVTAPFAGGWAPLVIIPSVSYPSQLEARLRSTYPLQTPTVTNASYPGTPAGVSFNRFVTEFVRVQPEVVLLVMGYNDVGTAADVTVGANVLDSMVREAQSRRARVFIGTLTPTIPGRVRSLNATLVDTMNVRIRGIAANRGAHLVDLFQGFQPAISTWVGVDGLHPTEAGYVRIAELFLSAIRANLESAVGPTTALP